jgi:2-methylcitrate dehydratase
MSTLNRGVRTATRNLRLPAIQSRTLRAPLAIASRAKFGASTRPATFKQFSTMSPLQSGAPPPPQAREYDPEIKDIASYVHHTAIESDLAVSFTRRFVE